MKKKLTDVCSGHRQTGRLKSNSPARHNKNSFFSIGNSTHLGENGHHKVRHIESNYLAAEGEWKALIGQL